MPRRDTLVPEEIVALWPHIPMVDVLDEGTDYHFRLVGQRLVDTYGEQTGRKLSHAAISDVVRARCRQIFDFCRAHGAPTYAYWSESAPDPRPLIEVEALSLTLSHAGSAPDRLTPLPVNPPTPGSQCRRGATCPPPNHVPQREPPPLPTHQAL